MKSEEIASILTEKGFEVRKSEPRGLVVYRGYSVGQIRLHWGGADVEVQYDFVGANYGSQTMAEGVAELRKVIDQEKIPYIENPTREEFLKHERRLIEGLEKSIAEAKERIALVGGSR